MFTRRYLAEITAAVALLCAIGFVQDARAGLLGGGAINGAVGGGAFNGAMNGHLSRQPLNASGSLSGSAQVQRPAVKPVVQDASEHVQGSMGAASAAAIDKSEKAIVRGEAAASMSEATAKKTTTAAQPPALHGDVRATGDVSRHGVDVDGTTMSGAQR